MWTFKVSKKPNVLNLQFEFCPPPQEAPRGGAKKKDFALRACWPPKIISVYALDRFKYKMAAATIFFINVHIFSRKVNYHPTGGAQCNLLALSVLITTVCFNSLSLGCKN